MTTTDHLTTMTARIVYAAFKEYFKAHPDMKYSAAEATAAINRHSGLGYGQGMADAKEAFACGMSDVAETTFRASLVQAGINAAKEVAVAK